MNEVHTGDYKGAKLLINDGTPTKKKALCDLFLFNRSIKL